MLTKAIFGRSLNNQYISHQVFEADDCSFCFFNREIAEKIESPSDVVLNLVGI